jgi:hypothetical protein
MKLVYAANSVPTSGKSINSDFEFSLFTRLIYEMAFQLLYCGQAIDFIHCAERRSSK